MVPRYAVYQLERGDQGTPHFQGAPFFFEKKGYIVYNGPRRISAINTDLNNLAWIHTRNGGHSQARHYCCKPIPDCDCQHCDGAVRLQGPWFFGSEEGIPESQGERSDLAAVKRKLDEGAKLKTIAEEHFSDFCRYNRSFREYKRLKAPKRHHLMEVIVLFGGTGTGKTRYAYDHYGDDIYSVPEAKGSGTYWDDYDEQETVLVDECYGKRFTHGFLLQLLDRYPFTVPVHGSAVNFSSKRIIMTSNTHPREWYHGMYESHPGMRFEGGPLERRMTDGDSCILEVLPNHVLRMDTYKLSF